MIQKKKKKYKTGREPTWKSQNAFTSLFSTNLKRSEIHTAMTSTLHAHKMQNIHTKFRLVSFDDITSQSLHNCLQR